MPVIDAPPSPEYERSPSPDNDRDVDRDAAGPSKKPRLTVADIQRRQLDKLLANPDKEVKLPAGMAERIGGVRAPKEIIKSVAGSASAAGSGEFHVYKHSRRREAERIRHMEETNKALDEQKAFQDRQAARDALTDAKTAKNRAKRAKRKAGRGSDKPSGSASAAPTGSSKFAQPPSAFGLRRASDGGHEGDGAAPTGAAASTSNASSKFSAPASAHEQLAMRDEGTVKSAEVKISIVDED